MEHVCQKMRVATDNDKIIGQGGQPMRIVHIEGCHVKISEGNTISSFGLSPTALKTLTFHGSNRIFVMAYMSKKKESGSIVDPI